MQSALSYVVDTLKKRAGENIPFSELEKLLASQPKMLGFGVEPHHVVQSMLQLGRVSYDEKTEIVQLQDKTPEAIVRRGQEYLLLLERDPTGAEEYRKSTSPPETIYLDALRTIHRVHGYDKAALIFK